MTIVELMEKKSITKYRLSKNCKVPYATIQDICSGKAQLNKCSAETIYKISKELNVTMESLLEPYLVERIDFDLFKSNVCHRLKELGDKDFVIEVLENDDITLNYNKKWYPESLYLLAMLDYVSRENNIPICTKYDNIRKSKLSEIIYPASVISEYCVTNDDRVKERAVRNSIPEFIRFNIVENEVRNVI